MGDAIYCTGRAELPILVVPLELRLTCPESLGCHVDFREIRCRVSPFDQSYIAFGRPAPMQVRLAPKQAIPNRTVILEIPLDRTRLAAMDRLRNGGDVRLRLDFELLTDEVVKIGESKEKVPSPIWGLKEHNISRANLQIVIPRSRWVDQVLAQTGFWKIHIFELPAIPLESCAGVQKAFDALQHAYKLETQGFYDDAVGKCRVALEPFFEIVEKIDRKGEKQKVPVLKTSWEKRLGKATYEWLNASLVALKEPTNQPHHHSSTIFDQLEAQMLLTVTTAVVAYAVKSQPPAGAS